MPPPIPILLLKAPSHPTDAYRDLLQQTHPIVTADPPSPSSLTPPAPPVFRFAPRFAPVIQKRFLDDGLDTLASLLRDKRIGPGPDADYGGLIFTSQIAVEAFTKVVTEDESHVDSGWTQLQQVPIYTVGPATTRSLLSIPRPHSLQTLGDHTGNGEALAAYILQHYPQHRRSLLLPGSDDAHPPPSAAALPPLLFLVGEKRRDIIPKTLTSDALPPDQRIPVREVTVYGTETSPSFPADFDAALAETVTSSSSSSSTSSPSAPLTKTSRWVVVFSPNGCDSMLRALGFLDPDTNRFAEGRRDGSTRVATIGPTTRTHLLKNFDFEPDVCAETPTPEGVLRGILAFEEKQLQQ